MLSDWTAVESSVASIMSDVDFNMPGPSVSPSVLIRITIALHLYFMFVTRWRCRPADPVQANNSYWGKQLGDAVRNGMIPERRFDDMVRVCLVLQFSVLVGFKRDCDDSSRVLWTCIISLVRTRVTQPSSAPVFIFITSYFIYNQLANACGQLRLRH